MNNKDTWPTHKNEPDDSLKPEDAISNEKENLDGDLEARERREIVEEILSKPPRMFINENQMAQLDKNGEAVLAGINFRGREVKPDAEIILIYPDRREVSAMYVETTRVNKSTVEIKVRLPNKE